MFEALIDTVRKAWIICLEIITPRCGSCAARVRGRMYFSPLCGRYLGADLRSLQRFMAEQSLERAYVGTVFQRQRGKL